MGGLSPAHVQISIDHEYDKDADRQDCRNVDQKNAVQVIAT